MANTLNVQRNGAVGFIDWLDLSVTNEEADGDGSGRRHHLTSTAMAIVAADIV